MKEMLTGINYHTFYPFLLLPDDSAGRNARELWWTSLEFYPTGIITMDLHAYISSGGWTIGTLTAEVQRHNLIPST
jgi:hypothetical protein